MARYSPENERIKHRYFEYLAEAGGKSSKTIENTRKALIRFEEFTSHASFKSFDDRQAVAFKEDLLKGKNMHGKPLSLSTIAHALSHLKDFLKWLAMQPGYRKSIRFPDIEYLNLIEKDRRKIQSKNPPKEYPSLEQIDHVLAIIPHGTDVEKRNRALIAFLITSGVRDGALIGLKLKHVNTEKKYIVQDPKEVDTKFGKRINSTFFPVGDQAHGIVLEWVRYLRQEKLFGDNDPLFPKEQLTQDETMSLIGGVLSREHWRSATAVRRILKEAFELAGLKYYKPHSFRDTLSSLGRKLCTTTEDQMAWAWNLGQENPTTTFITYGGFTTEKQFDAMERLSRKSADSDESNLDALAAALMKRLK